MPRRPKVHPVRAAILALGLQLGHQLGAIAQAPKKHVTGKRPGRPAPVGAAAVCVVPGCTRKKVAKGVCQNHYAKAKKLKMNLDKLGPADLRLLGQDGRALRWKKVAAKKSASAGLSRRGPKRGKKAKK